MSLYRHSAAALIFVLLSAVVLMLSLRPQVRADSTSIDSNVSGASVNDRANRSILLGSPTPTRTPTPPFTCSLLSLSNKRLAGNQFNIDIENDNVVSAVINRVQITWPNIPAFAQMGLTQMSLNTAAIWNGNDPQGAGPTTITDTDTKPGTPPFLSTSASLRSVNALDIETYAATFNGPPLLSTYVSVSQYTIIITIDNPLDAPSPCVLTSAATVPSATPTFAGVTMTATPTPDCSPGLIEIKFNKFDNFGIVEFDIRSQRNTPSTLVGFNINWQKYVNSQKLVRVSLVAPFGSPGAVVVWSAADMPDQDVTPPTNSQTEGTWLTNYTIPRGFLGSPSITPMYFDFEGIYRYDDYSASYVPQYGGTSDFNGSDFALSCSDASGDQIVQVSPEVVPSPTYLPTQTPTTTSTATYTPTSTSTASRTPTATATLTASVVPPPTSTYTPSNTPTPTNTATDTPTPTATNTPTDTSTPVTPTSAPDVAPSNYFYTTRTPTLTWSRVSWATGYEIQISMDKKFPFTATFTQFLSAQTLAYTTNTMENGTYYWRVMALGSGGTTNFWSTIGSFAISAPPPSPTP